jgi:serine kinase of HPr protein (carbohydrate metabolism regulator)
MTHLAPGGTAILSSEILHATSIAIDGRAVLLEGLSGTGKSDLALRLIDRGAVLISDDRTLLVRTGQHLVARAPGTIRGQIEVRGLGIVAMPQVDDIPVALIVRLGEEPMRMPERRQRRLAGIVVREVAFEAFHASTPVKIEWALRQPEATPE